jgi:hypothetical protein
MEVVLPPLRTLAAYALRIIKVNFCPFRVKSAPPPFEGKKREISGKWVGVLLSMEKQITFSIKEYKSLLYVKRNKYLFVEN